MNCCTACGATRDDDAELCPPCRARDLDEALAETIEAAPPEAPRPPLDLRPAFVGRGEAMSRLERVLDDTIGERRLGVALVIGEPGLGKTRLLDELARRAATRPGVRVLTAATRALGGAHDVFARLLARRFDLRPSDPADEARDKIVAGVGGVMPAARVSEVAHLLAQLMRLPFPASPIVGPLSDAPQQLEARTFLALRRFLAADAEQGAIVLGFDNLELADAESVRLFHYLAAGLARSPVLLVGTATPALFERTDKVAEIETPVARIELGPLEPAEAAALLGELGRAFDAVPPRLLEQAGRLGGSPRAIVELVRLLVETGIVRPGDGGWTLDAAALAAAELPDRHDALIAARIAALVPVDRATLEMGAVVGETFWLDGVVALGREVEARGRPDPDGPTLAEIAEAGDRGRTGVGAALRNLAERDLIEEIVPSSVPGEHEYRFVDRAAWRAVYAGVDEVRRRRYHRLVAQHLELRGEARAALEQEDVGGHLERAGDAVGAAARYRRAGDLARAGFANERAIRLYSQALACLGDSDLAVRIQLWHDLGSIYELRGDYEAALGAFERMLRLAWVAASRTKAAVAFNKMGRVWRRRGDLALAVEYLERGRELFLQADDTRGVAASDDDVGLALYLLGRYDEAHAKVEAGLAGRGRDGDRRSIARSRSNLGRIQRDRGRLAEAEANHREALALRRAIGDRIGAIASLTDLADLAFDHGDLAAARRGHEEALREAEEVGALPMQALALANLGELALAEDRHEEARRRLEDSLEIAREIADRRLEVEATRTLALLEHRATNAARARELARHAYQTAASAGLREVEGRTLLTLGEVFGGTVFDADGPTVRDGDGPDPAEGFFSRGVELLRKIGNPGELARGLERYGRYRIERGDLPGGRDLLEEARRLFAGLGLGRAAALERVLG